MKTKTQLYIAGFILFGLSSCNAGQSSFADGTVTSKPVASSASSPSAAPPASKAPTHGVSVSAPMDKPHASTPSENAPSAFDAGGRSIAIGAPKSYENLTLIPLLAAPSPNEGSIHPLDEAMDKGALTIRELESETVPTLRVKNSGDKPVFIMTGEIVTGAKQDRMSAHDVLIKAKSRELALSVYCVEQGRWVETSRQFASAKIAGTTSLRKNAAKKSSQGTIWSKVKEKSDEAAVSSTTSAMQAVFNDPNVQTKAAAFEESLGPWAREQSEMVGFVAAIDGRVVSADLFAQRALFQALFPKLLRASAIDALTSKSPAKSSPAVSEVKAFLDRGLSAKQTKTDNPGLGEEFLIEADNDQSGTVLIYNNEIIHLSLFGAERQNNPRALRLDPTTGLNAAPVSASNTGMSPNMPQSTILGLLGADLNGRIGSDMDENDVSEPAPRQRRTADSDEAFPKAQRRFRPTSKTKSQSKPSSASKSKIVGASFKSKLSSVPDTNTGSMKKKGSSDHAEKSSSWVQ